LSAGSGPKSKRKIRAAILRMYMTEIRIEKAEPVRVAYVEIVGPCED